MVEIMKVKSMFVSGKYNTDAAALDQRIKSHSKFGSRDLNKWIFENMNLHRGLSVLDLGSGTGKQSIPIAKAIGDSGSVCSVDLSQEALDSLMDKAYMDSVNNNIKTLNCGHDDIHLYLDNNQFDRVVSSYSLYYTNDTDSLIRSIWDKLNDNGILFFCGPSSQNNKELKEFHYSISDKEEPTTIGASIFMEGVGMKKTIEIFKKVDVVTFENVLKFDSAQELYNYWSSYNLYEESIDENFNLAAQKYFETNKIFKTVKRVIGIKAYK